MAQSPNFDTPSSVTLGKDVYIQKKMLVEVSNYSPPWKGSSLAVHYPLTHNGEVYGHVGVSSKLSEVEMAYWQAWLYNLVTILLVWLSSILILRKLYQTLTKNLVNLSNHIKNENDSTDGIKDFPELEPVLNTVIELRLELKQQADE